MPLNQPIDILFHLIPTGTGRVIDGNPWFTEMEEISSQIPGNIFAAVEIHVPIVPINGRSRFIFQRWAIEHEFLGFPADRAVFYWTVDRTPIPGLEPIPIFDGALYSTIEQPIPLPVPVEVGPGVFGFIAKSRAPGTSVQSLITEGAGNRLGWRVTGVLVDAT